MNSPHRLDTVDILGIRFASLNATDAVDEAERLFDQSKPAWIAVENVHALNLAAADPAHSHVLDSADLLLNDGKGLQLGARILGASFPADLNGNLFTPLLLDRAAERGWRVFLLGSSPGVVQRAREVLEVRHPGLRVVDTRDGYIPPGGDDDVCAQIAQSGAELLLVGMGMPLQERWLDNHLHDTGVRLASTVGAFFDFQAGTVRRAPGWLNRVGLEWAFRLLVEPRRLWRRYLIGNPAFLWRILKQRLGAAPTIGPGTGTKPDDDQR